MADPSPYMSLEEVIEHIGYASEKARTRLASNEIRAGDWFKIKAPGEPLHGTRHECIGVNPEAVNPETGEKTPWQIETRLRWAEYPKLVKLPNPRPKDLDKDTYAVRWPVDERKCELDGPRDPVNEAVIAMAFAAREITSGAGHGKIVVKGSRKGHTYLEEIPADHWHEGRLDVLEGRLYAENPFARGAVVWERLCFPCDEVGQLWKRAQQVGDGAETKYAKWEARQASLCEGGMTLNKAAEEIAREEDVDAATVLRETRRLRRQREKAGTK